MDSNRKLFKDVVFEIYKDGNNYDKIIFSFMKIYDIYIEKVGSFKKMKVETQFWICETAYLISLGASQNSLRKGFVFSIPKPKDFEIKYSIDFGFKKPELTEINEEKAKLLGGVIKPE